MVALAHDTLDRLLDPIAACLTPEVASRIASLQLDSTLADRLEDYADRSNEGKLTHEEQVAYKELVELVDLISLMQVKARKVMAR